MADKCDKTIGEQPKGITFELSLRRMALTYLHQPVLIQLFSYHLIEFVYMLSDGFFNVTAVLY